ncbi:YciI family protein [Xanthobacter sp. KR7-65]|uniref:YciI family protein n=1 Tax=Xanthobacter sp. KR7-65 TaxID=3156612 RepID=UPI0032B59313
MPYMIETFDKPGTLDLRARVRDEHLAFLAENAKLLLACGAKLDDDGNAAGGGLYVVALETRAEAEAFIAADPFHKAGLFERVAITRWRKAYLDGVSYLPPAQP